MQETNEQDRRKIQDWFGDEAYFYYNGRYRLVIKIKHTTQEFTQELNIGDVYECNNRSYKVVGIQRDYNTLTDSYELISYTPIV